MANKNSNSKLGPSGSGPGAGQNTDPRADRDTTFFTPIHLSAAEVLPKDLTPKNFKVLLVYPNYSMVNLLPTNIGILTACLRQNGFIVDLFDTTSAADR